MYVEDWQYSRSVQEQGTDQKQTRLRVQEIIGEQGTDWKQTKLMLQHIIWSSRKLIGKQIIYSKEGKASTLDAQLKIHFKIFFIM
jgi:hypothetical protein